MPTRRSTILMAAISVAAFLAVATLTGCTFTADLEVAMRVQDQRPPPPPEPSQ